MRDYEEFPDSLNFNSLFYIGNYQNLNLETLKKLHNHFINQKQFFSLEKLIKGKEKARVIFGPRSLVTDFPELNLVEIEDYLAGETSLLTPDQTAKTTTVNETLSWLVEPKNNPKKVLMASQELSSLTVENDQKVFMQSVLMPLPQKEGTLFQGTLRVMVAEPDPIKRIELAKKINEIFAKATGLNKHEDNFAEMKKFESFKQRSLIPKEVAEFPLTSEEVLMLVS